MATKLGIYNGALRILGVRALSSLTDNRPERRELDSLWMGNDAINKCLAAGQWNWASRSVKIPYDVNVTPAFGYERAYAKPSDFVRTTYFATDEMFTNPMINYVDVGSYWYGSLDEVYVRYVSNDAAVGANLGAWPVQFADYVEAYCAEQLALVITESTKKQDKAQDVAKKALAKALAWDAMEAPGKILPAGTWTNSRFGGHGVDRYRHGGFLG